MGGLQAVMDWVAAHLQAVLYVARAHWHAAMTRLGPPVQAALDWADASVQAAIVGTRSRLRAALATVRPHIESLLGVLAAHWYPIVMTAAGASVAIAALIVAVKWLRRRRRIKATLVEVTLDRDPQTAWLNLAIVVRNFQRHALTVQSLKVLQPAGTKVCERWKAWVPADDGARFVAADLDLTDAAEIERTIRPHGASSQYDDLGDEGRQRPVDPDELKRSFYLLPPGASVDEVSVRAVLHCKIENRRGSKQRLAFRRTLAQTTASPAGSPSTV